MGRTFVCMVAYFPVPVKLDTMGRMHEKSDFDTCLCCDIFCSEYRQRGCGDERDTAGGAAIWLQCHVLGQPGKCRGLWL